MQSRLNEITRLQKLFDKSPNSHEFHELRQTSKWGENIKSDVIDLITPEDPEAIEDGLFFLELNPRYFRSGYFKGKIAVKLKSVDLSLVQQSRLRDVLLNAIQSTNVGPEFPEYARLISKVGNHEFVSTIEDLRHNTEGWQQERCERLLRHWHQNMKSGGN